MLLVNKKSASLVTFLGLCFVASIWLLIVAGTVYGSVYWYFRPSYVVETPLCLVPSYDSRLNAVLDLPMPSLNHEDYSITLELVLPRSPENQRLGYFVATLEFQDLVVDAKSRDNTGRDLVLNFQGSAMLPFKSYIIDTLDQWVFSPLYVFGFKEQTELIPISLSDHVENPNRRFSRLELILSEPIQLTSAKLVWSTKLSGLRKFMYYSPFMSCFVFVGTLWFVGIVTTITVCLLVWVRTSIDSPSAPKQTKSASSKCQDEKVNVDERHPPKRSSSASLHFEWNGSVPSAYSTARFSPTRPRSRRQTRQKSSSRGDRSRASLYHPVKSEYNDSVPDESEEWQEETLPTINSDFDIKQE